MSEKRRQCFQNQEVCLFLRSHLYSLSVADIADIAEGPLAESDDPPRLGAVTLSTVTV